MSTTFFVIYPTNPISISAIGTNGATAPTASIQVAGVGVDGNLHPLSTTNTGILNVNLSSTTTTPLPVTDAAAELSLASIDTKTPALGQALMAASTPITIASNQSALAVSQSGAWSVTAVQATATNLKTQAEAYQGGAAVAAGNPLQVTLANTGANATALKVDATATIQPVSGTVTANQGTANTNANGWFARLTDGTRNVTVTAASTAPVATDLSLVVGLSPNGNQAKTTQFPTALGAQLTSAAMAITLASDQAPSTGYIRSATGSFTATSQTVAINPSGCNSIYVQLSGTFVATFTMEASADNGTTWTNLFGWDQANVGFTATGNVSGRVYVFPAYGNTIRARCSAFTSGTMVVTMIAGLGPVQSQYVSPVTFFPVQGSAALASSGTGVQPLQVGGLYQTSPTALTNGQQGALQQDVNQNLKVTQVGNGTATSANTSVDSSALEASHVVKNAAGRLFTLSGVNTKTSAQYIQVFNSTTVPADTAVPILVAYVPAGANFSWDFPFGKYFSTGIAVSNSSTAATKTIGSADCWFDAEYL